MANDLKHVAFVGPAGVGKTFGLVNAVREHLLRAPLAPYQAVLGLTFMHGARRRLTRKLHDALGAHVRLECLTIDSFALNLVRRYRRHIGMSGLIEVCSPVTSDWQHTEGQHRAGLDRIREAAIRLLVHPEIAAATGTAHPILVVDEFQDCEEGLLAFVQSLSAVSASFIAADDFQALSTTSEPPAVRWLCSNFDVTHLDHVHRTDEPHLLRTARALRGGARDDGGVEVVICGHAFPAAFRVASSHLWNRWAYSRTVMLTPSGPHGAPFVRDILALLDKPLVSKKHRFPAYPYLWTASHHEEKQLLLTSIRSMGDRVEFHTFGQNQDPLIEEVLRRCAARCRIQGRSSVTSDELAELAESAISTIHAHTCLGDGNGRLAMTIHAAKNQEFENVIVLWPYQRAPDPLLQRKLLYNAVTRAKRRAVILVQGSEKKLAKDPVLGLIWTPSLATPRKPKRRAGI